MWFSKGAFVIVILIYLNPVDGLPSGPHLININPQYCKKMKNETKLERELKWKRCGYEKSPSVWQMDPDCVKRFDNSTDSLTTYECCEGFFGHVCEKLCYCHPDNTMECGSQTDGHCRCKSGYYGKQCELRCSNGSQACRLVDETTIRSYNNLVTGLACSVIALFSFSVFVFHKFNLKAKRLKKELKTISMRCAMDRGEFENPVYIIDSPSNFDSPNSTKQQNSQ